MVQWYLCHAPKCKQFPWEFELGSLCRCHTQGLLELRSRTTVNGLFWWLVLGAGTASHWFLGCLLLGGHLWSRRRYLVLNVHPWSFTRRIFFSGTLVGCCALWGCCNSFTLGERWGWPIGSCMCDLWWGCMGGAGFARVSFHAQPVQISHSVVIVLICAFYVSVGASLMAPESVLSPWRIQSSGVMVGYVMNLCRNSTVSETIISLVFAGITTCQR